MAIITLLSDWGTTDYYVAAVKGKILSLLPDATIVDISHNIRHFDVVHAGFTIRNCYKAFPEGTIHLLCVNEDCDQDVGPVVVKFNGQYFIGADNGIFDYIIDGPVDDVYRIDLMQDGDAFTFGCLSRFVNVAALLAKGSPMSDVGDKLDSFQTAGVFQAAVHSHCLVGNVIHVDEYGNAITNISSELFDKVVGFNKVEISIEGYIIAEISERYSDVCPQELVAVFGSHGFLEVAMNCGAASSLCGIKVGSRVTVNY